jgi:uncharacterized membrane protein
VLAAAYMLLFGWLSLHRYWGYQMHAQDMGNMGQAAWNTIHGHPFFFTNVRLPGWHMEAWGTTTRLSFHVEPIFPLISLVYFIYAAPESLIVLQTVALGLGVFPVYLLARDLLGSRAFGVLFAAIYTLIPSLEAMNEYEFHAVSLATPLLIAAFLFAYRRQWWLFGLSCLLAAGTKEEIGLVVGLLGLYVAVILRERLVGFVTAGLGVLWSLVAVFVVEKHFRPAGSLTYMHSRYGYLEGSGHGLHGVISTLLHDPGSIAAQIIIWPKVGYLWLLLIPTGFLALLAPEIVLIGVPTLILNLLSSQSAMYSGLGDNSAELIAVLIVAAIIGAGRLLTLLRPYVRWELRAAPLGAYLAVMAAGAQVAYGYTPAGPNFVVAQVGAHQQLADRFVALVPPLAPVATQDQLDPHLSSRHYLYLFGDTGRSPLLQPANDVLLDVSAGSYAYTPSDVYARAQSLLRQGWGVVAAIDGLIYLRKGVPNKTIPPAFYTYIRSDGLTPERPLRGEEAGLKLVGYDLAKTDQPNHPIPVLNFTIYLQPVSRSTPNVMPVVWELMQNGHVACVTEHGLDWLPSPRWAENHLYRVGLQGLETDDNIPGNVPLFLTLEPYAATFDCTTMWRHHSALTSLGSVRVSPL